MVQSTMNKVGSSREQVFDVVTVLAVEKNFPMGTLFGGRAAKCANQKARRLEDSGNENNKEKPGGVVGANVGVAQKNDNKPEAPNTDELTRLLPEFQEENDVVDHDDDDHDIACGDDEDEESDVKIGWCGAVGSNECDDALSDYNTDEDEDYLPSSVAAPPPKRYKLVAASKKRRMRIW